MVKKAAKVSIIIPVYNEKNTVKHVIKSVLKADTCGLKKELIIVDDNSTDETGKILKIFRKTKSMKIIKNSENKGKGYSVRQGIINSTGDIVLIQDADLEYNPKDYPRLLLPIIEGHAEVVYGTRFLDSGPHRVFYFYHYIANRFITTMSNFFTNLNLTDIETGYKAFDGKLLRLIASKLESDDYCFEVEVTVRLAKVPKVRFYEVGIAYYGRTYEEGKKINWTDGVMAIWAILKYGFLVKSRNYQN